MYEFPKRPVTPRLIRITDGNDEIPGGLKNYSLYSLDWKPKEERVRKDHNDRSRRGNGPIISGRPPTDVFPEDFISKLYDLRFWMDVGYVKEIAYQAKRGQEEWSRTFPDNHICSMDTAVREHMLGAAVTHFESAFYLLSDCSVDGSLKRLNRESFFHKVMMLMYFWDGQTGSGLIEGDEHSGGFHKLKGLYVDPNDKWGENLPLSDEVQNFRTSVQGKMARLHRISDDGNQS